MIYRIYGQKDTTIYEQNNRNIQNSGKDEILEIKFSERILRSLIIGFSSLKPVVRGICSKKIRER